MADQTIMIIRHAEKPEDGGAAGVDAEGQTDPKSLTPRGWQRAGAWVALFQPALGRASALPTPTMLFASAPATHAELAGGQGGSKSRRPLETITPLAARLGNMPVDLRFGKGREADLAAALSTTNGVTLVCWQHETIADIANALVPAPSGVPADWPGTRFNVVYTFSRPDGATPWAFTQVVPVMLDGDSAASI